MLPGEDPAELDALRDDLRCEHQPATATEEILVNELAEHYWRLRRMRKYEARIMGSGSIEELHKGFVILPIVQRTMAAAERGFHKALTALQKLQKERAKSPESATVASDSEQPAGFVPQNPLIGTDSPYPKLLGELSDRAVGLSLAPSTNTEKDLMVNQSPYQTSFAAA